MSHHHDLLDHAKRIVENPDSQPVDLRRAVSAAYYALFHLLVDEATSLMIRDPQLQQVVRRCFQHTEMKAVSESFATGSLSPAIRSICHEPVTPQLANVARTFSDLQVAREAADYRIEATFSLIDATDLIKQAEAAFADWESIKSARLAKVFLVALLIKSRLRT